MRKWYIAQTYSGSESSVKNDIEARIQSMNMQDKVYQVLVPEHQVEETKKDGTKKIKVEKIFPGYVFVEMEVDPQKGMDDQAWFMIRNTPKVTGFLGSSGNGTKPTPVATDEMNTILRNLGLMEKPKLDFEVGDKVTITTGSFAGQVGEIINLNEEKQLVTVAINFLGTVTPAEFGATDVKKA